MATQQQQFSEIGPEVDPSTIYAVYEAEVELNPDAATRTHNLAFLTLHFPDGRTMKVSLCPVICRSVGGWIGDAGEAYLNDYLEESWRDI